MPGYVRDASGTSLLICRAFSQDSMPWHVVCSPHQVHLRLDCTVAFSSYLPQASAVLPSCPSLAATPPLRMCSYVCCQHRLQGVGHGWHVGRRRFRVLASTFGNGMPGCSNSADVSTPLC